MDIEVQLEACDLFSTLSVLQIDVGAEVYEYIFLLAMSRIKRNSHQGDNGAFQVDEVSLGLPRDYRPSTRDMTLSIILIINFRHLRQ